MTAEKSADSYQCHLQAHTQDYCSPPPESFEYGMLKLQVDGESCFGCGSPILERFLLQVSGQAWHIDCLRCSSCSLLLEPSPSCYVKDERIFCKACYTRQFGVKCARCSRVIQATDWVRRARQFVYHLACFACDSCKRQLSTGEEFALQESRVLCKTHYMELLEGDSHKASQKQKSKRVRTTFTEEQLQVLQANFQIDSNPDGQDLERIAQLTGLSKRVTQVWFQNSRARQKKYQGQNRKANPSGSHSKSSNSPESDVSSPSQTPTLDYSPDSDALRGGNSMELDRESMGSRNSSVCDADLSVVNAIAGYDRSNNTSFRQ